MTKNPRKALQTVPIQKNQPDRLIFFILYSTRSSGAISRFIFFIAWPGNAISAITPESATMVPVQNFSWRTRSQRPRDPTATVGRSFFSFGERFDVVEPNQLNTFFESGVEK